MGLTVARGAPATTHSSVPACVSTCANRGHNGAWMPYGGAATDMYSGMSTSGHIDAQYGGSGTSKAGATLQLHSGPWALSQLTDDNWQCLGEQPPTALTISELQAPGVRSWDPNAAVGQYSAASAAGRGNVFATEFHGVRDANHGTGAMWQPNWGQWAPRPLRTEVPPYMMPEPASLPLDSGLQASGGNIGRTMLSNVPPNTRSGLGVGEHSNTLADEVHGVQYMDYGAGGGSQPPWGFGLPHLPTNDAGQYLNSSALLPLTDLGMQATGGPDAIGVKTDPNSVEDANVAVDEIRDIHHDEGKTNATSPGCSDTKAPAAIKTRRQRVWRPTKYTARPGGPVSEELFASSTRLVDKQRDRIIKPLLFGIKDLVETRYDSWEHWSRGTLGPHTMRTMVDNLYNRLVRSDKTQPDFYDGLEFRFTEGDKPLLEAGIYVKGTEGEQRRFVRVGKARSTRERLFPKASKLTSVKHSYEEAEPDFRKGLHTTYGSMAGGEQSRDVFADPPKDDQPGNGLPGTTHGDLAPATSSDTEQGEDASRGQISRPGTAEPEDLYMTSDDVDALQKTKLKEVIYDRIWSRVLANGYTSWEDWSNRTNGPNRVRTMVESFYNNLESDGRTAPWIFGNLDIQLSTLALGKRFLLEAREKSKPKVEASGTGRSKGQGQAGGTERARSTRSRFNAEQLFPSWRGRSSSH